MSSIDAIIVGAGPNGLAAAIELARAGRSVRVIERKEEVGGGMRTAELTLPGFRHDVCSAVHPLAAGSPFLSDLGLERYGLELVAPAVDAAHPLDDGTAVTLSRSLGDTAATLGPDGAQYARVLGPLVRSWPELAKMILGPLRIPRHPLLATQFGLAGALSATAMANTLFSDVRARSLIAGMAAHAMRPLSAPITAGFALVLLALGHAVGWPVVRGGSQQLAAAMRAQLEFLGGQVQTGCEVRSLREVADASVVLFDVSPRQLVWICGEELPRRYRSALGRYRYGPGVFKLDYALAGPVPWRAPECAKAGTVHLGGTFEEIAASELAVSRGSHSQRPYVLVAQQSMVDATRAPAGKHTLWAYCHVPNGSEFDMTGAIENQIERFAPGFRELVLARSARGPTQLEAENPNYIGGDINCGLASLRQTLVRPVLRVSPYSTPNPRIFLCSSATPPGGGVHGMCGYHAAHAVMRHGLS